MQYFPGVLQIWPHTVMDKGPQAGVFRFYPQPDAKDLAQMRALESTLTEILGAMESVHSLPMMCSPTRIPLRCSLDLPVCSEVYEAWHWQRAMEAQARASEPLDVAEDLTGGYYVEEGDNYKYRFDEDDEDDEDEDWDPETSASDDGDDDDQSDAEDELQLRDDMDTRVDEFVAHLDTQQRPAPCDAPMCVSRLRVF
eukprot:724794-Prymnesium_polylepis.1